MNANLLIKLILAQRLLTCVKSQMATDSMKAKLVPRHRLIVLTMLINKSNASIFADHLIATYSSSSNTIM